VTDIVVTLSKNREQTSDRSSNGPVEESWKAQVTDTVMTLLKSCEQTSDRRSNDPVEESWKTQVTPQ